MLGGKEVKNENILYLELLDLFYHKMQFLFSSGTQHSNCLELRAAAIDVLQISFILQMFD